MTIAALCLVASASAQICTPGWDLPLFENTAPDFAVRDSIVWDDGRGESLFVCGFGSGSRPADPRWLGYANVGRWNGRYWEPIGDSAQWHSVPGFDGPAEFQCMAVFDDGDGESLYFAGEFENIGNMEANSIVRWDGAAWHVLGTPDGVGVNGTIQAIESYDDGSGPALYIGGRFSIPGFEGEWAIARWDGTAWTPLASETLGNTPLVWDFEVFDDGAGTALFVYGVFEELNEVVCSGIAKWDGTSFVSLEHSFGIGIDSRESFSGIGALKVFDDGTGDALYLAGAFYVNTPEQSGVPFFAKWDGAEFRPADDIDEWISGIPATLAVETDANGDDASLLIGGSFRAFSRTDGSGFVARGLARLVGGRLEAGHGSQSWEGLADAAGLDYISTISEFSLGGDHALYMGGRFSWYGAAPFSESHNSTALLGGVWYHLGNGSIDGTVHAFAVHDAGEGPQLHIGGNFRIGTGEGGVAIRSVARWNGFAWDQVAPAATSTGLSGIEGTVYALASHDDGNGPVLYIGGDFDTDYSGDVVLRNITRVRNGAYEQISDDFGITGCNGTIRALHVHDDGDQERLYAGGEFTSFGFRSAAGVAVLDGESFATLAGGGVSQGSVNVLQSFDVGDGPRLAVGGSFLRVGGEVVNGVAAYDGTDWSPLVSGGASGVNGVVLSLASGNIAGSDMLVLGGDFSEAGGLATGPVAVWNGVTWDTLNADTGLPSGVPVRALTFFSDGDSSVLYAGSATPQIGRGIARFEDGTWIDDVPDAMEYGKSGSAFPASAFELIEVNGRPVLIATAAPIGGSPVRYGMNAYWACPLPICLADLEPDGILDLNDIVAFVTGFTTLDPIADLADPVGTFDLADIVAFVTAFNAGCP